MKNLVARFTGHLREALAIGKTLPNGYPGTIRNILITGLGGSGIGGEIVSELCRAKCTMPIVTNHDYQIPGFVGPETLVIGCSYSGNTEETLEALKLAKERGATIAIVTSGGSLLEQAKEEGWLYMHIPGGLPPRAAFGYSFTSLHFLLHAYGLIDQTFVDTFTKMADYLDAHMDSIRSKAKNLASRLFNKQIMLYSSLDYQGVIVRFRQQLNENAKVLCGHHALPEMNHNELVGWAGGSNDIAVVQVINEDDHPRTIERFRISQEIIGNHTDCIETIRSQGDNRLERVLYLVHLFDWTSCYLADLRGVDPIEVKVIDYLKNQLAKF